MNVGHGMPVQCLVMLSTLYIDSRIGDDFTSFLSTETGFGNVGLKDGKPFIEVKYGKIDVKKCFVSDIETDFVN